MSSELSVPGLVRKYVLTLHHSLQAREHTAKIAFAITARPFATQMRLRWNARPNWGMRGMSEETAATKNRQSRIGNAK